jgi:hypothetical protein
MIPSYGSKEWFEWKADLFAECYEILDFLARIQEPPAPRTYDPAFAQRKERPHD